MAKRPAGKQQIGSRQASVNEDQPTSAGKAAMYAHCSPNNWGMRYSTERDKMNGQLEYPVAHDYAKAIYALLLEDVQWGNNYFGPAGTTPKLKLTWPLNEALAEVLTILVSPVIEAALCATTPGDFGIPRSARPVINIYVSGDKIADQGGFTAQTWQLAINADCLRPLFSDEVVSHETSARRQQTQPLREFADTLYHEARHCQQSFWINAMVQQQPQNFTDTPNIAKWPLVAAAFYDAALAAIVVAAKEQIPDEPAAITGIKRMAVGQYLWQLNAWRGAGWYPPFASDGTSLDQEIAKARAAAADLLLHAGLGGTSIDVDKMAAEPYRSYVDYTGRPWEDDAFFCAQVATAYWNQLSGLALYTLPADQCSRIYERTYSRSAPAERLAGGQ